MPCRALPRAHRCSHPRAARPVRNAATASGRPEEAIGIIGCPFRRVKMHRAAENRACGPPHPAMIGAMDLRLFPLQTVLFPGMRLPLHIFEERYRIMIRECIEEDVPFGVLLIKSGPEAGGTAVPYDVGTTARIAQCEYLEDGRMNLFTVGVGRFRILTLNTTQPYLRGEVTPLEQVAADETARALVPRAQDLFNDYFSTYLALGNQWTRGVSLPDEPGEAADYIAARLDVPPELKQELLEELSPAARLTRELEVIAERLPDMRGRLATFLRQKTSGFGVLN